MKPKTATITNMVHTYKTTGRHHQAKLIVAANRMYCSRGPLPVQMKGKSTTPAQIKRADYTQLNYLDPLKNIGYVPEAYLADLANMKKMIRDTSSLKRIRSILTDGEYGGAADESIMKVFLEGLKHQWGMKWLPLSQLVAHEYVEEKLAAYDVEHALTNIDPLKLKSIITIHFYNVAYEVALDSAFATTKDNLGHLVAVQGIGQKVGHGYPQVPVALVEEYPGPDGRIKFIDGLLTQNGLSRVFEGPFGEIRI